MMDKGLEVQYFIRLGCLLIWGIMEKRKTDQKPELTLDTPIQFLKGVGPKLGSILSKRGIRTVKDLIHYYPRSYEDRRAARNIASLKEGELVSLKAQIVDISSYAMGKSHRKIYDILIRDNSGQIHCKFFRVPYKGYFERFKDIREVRVVGRITNYRGKLEFHHPDLRDIHPDEELEDDLLPIYTEIESITSHRIGKLIGIALSEIPKTEIPPEKFPQALQASYGLIPHQQALELLHRPNREWAAEYMLQRTKAHRRLIFEEFFWLELYLAARQSNLKQEHSPTMRPPGNLVPDFRKSLPFELTGAQQRVFEHIQKDLLSGKPMHRLVQGDVGSGKTVVAFLAALQVIESGYQACLMAPTEILAEQHFRNATKLMEPFGIRIGFLVGKTKAAERREILEKLASGETDFLIGTHALLEDPVVFNSLALVIVDEQHRFGVEQRAKLKEKGKSPHFLVMTATPIPRTLAMTVYGDLDVSLVDEMPPGRSPIQTRVIYESKRAEALKFMEAQIQKGRQAFVVYPLVEESEKMDLKNALEEFGKLQIEFPQIKFGLLHGRMKPEEKDSVMEQFRRAEIQILVSTTVIEVGVDIPNANIMIVEHSERFGLSQLHQMRGRVGRGQHKSFCVFIMGRAVSIEAYERTRFLESTTDGFKISEFDLEQRGPGEFLGTRQSGLPGFQLAHLVRDMSILQEAREAAFDLLKKDPRLKKGENGPLREELLRERGATALASIG